MNPLEAPSDLFGLPLTLPRQRVVKLVSDLEEAWLMQFDKHALTLNADLERLTAFFDPLAREATLRRRLEEIPTASVELPEVFALPIGPDRLVVTPEGRVTLEVLRALLSDVEGALVIEVGVLAAAHQTLADFYRHLARKRIDKVRALAAGKAGPMLPVAAAFVLLLLVNRSTSKDRALAQGETQNEREAINEAFVPVLVSFAEALTGEKFRGRDPSMRGLSLYQGYAVTEARRRLDPHIRLEGGRMWIHEENEETVLAFVARELSRRADPERALVAFDVLVEKYRTALPRLANLAFAHERPAHTAQLRKDLERLLRGS